MKRLRLAQPLNFSPPMPATYAECSRRAKPCPYWTCQHHNGPSWLQAHRGLSDEEAIEQFERTATLSVAHGVEVDASCSLAVAECGPQDQEQVAKILGLGRQRVSSIEREALRKLSDECEAAD